MTETNGGANQDTDATNGVVDRPPPANQGQQATANPQGGDAGPPPPPNRDPNGNAALETPAQRAARQLPDLVRQGERTVDNLKRLFAVVFATSFAIAGGSVIAKLKEVLLQQISSPPAWLWALNIEMIVVFLVTAAVFYHQSVKFLDIRYARLPLAQAHPWGFAMDYIQLVLTAAPFFLMANSLGLDLTHKVGYLWFFVSYVSLLALGLILLIVSQIRHSGAVRHGIWGEQIPEQEVQREALLRAYWMVMNGAILLILLGTFWYVSRGGTCPANPRDGTLPWMLYFFGVVAMARDYLDFRWAWPFLYPIGDDNPTSQLLQPLRWMQSRRVHRNSIWLGIVLIGADVYLLFLLKFWDFAKWTAACG